MIPLVLLVASLALLIGVFRRNADTMHPASAIGVITTMTLVIAILITSMAFGG